MRHHKRDLLWILAILIWSLFFHFTDKKTEVPEDSDVAADEVAAGSNRQPSSLSSCTGANLQNSQVDAGFKDFLNICDQIDGLPNNPYTENIKFCRILIPTDNSAEKLEKVRSLLKKQLSLRMLSDSFGSGSLQQYLVRPKWRPHFYATVILATQPGYSAPIFIQDVPSFIQRYGEINTIEKAQFFAESILNLSSYKALSVCDQYECYPSGIASKEPYLEGNYWIFENYRTDVFDEDSECGQRVYTVSLSTQGEAQVLSKRPVDEGVPSSCLH